MAGSITAYETAAGKRYRVRYRKPNSKQTDKRGFITKKDAQLFLASVTVSKARGEYVDPSLAKRKVGALYDVWIKGKTGLKPSAYAPLPIAWNRYVRDTWADREIGKIESAEVQAWVAQIVAPVKRKGQGRSASVALRALGVLAGILDIAVQERAIPRNPARGLKNLPKKPKRKARRTYLTHDQVHQLALESANPDIVRTLAYTGLRWSELAALHVRNVDTARCRISVEESAVLVNGVIEVGSPKSWQVRTVPYPPFLTIAFKRASKGKHPDDLLFGDGVAHLPPPRHTYGWLDGAVSRIQKRDSRFPRVTAHDLRHTAASLAVAAGANPLALQKMLGHESAAMTLDVYSDLFDDDLNAVAVCLQDAAREQSIGKSWASVVA